MAKLTNQKDPIILGLYKKADNVRSLDDLNELFSALQNHEYDYGTSVEACIIFMLGAFAAFNRDPNMGGFSGFQASILGSMLLRKFRGIKGPFFYREYYEFLKPDFNLEHDINVEGVMDEISKEAMSRLSTDQRNLTVEEIMHLTRIVEGYNPVIKK